MGEESRHCPNCAAPLDLGLGELETVCAYCRSRVRFVPDRQEMEVIRTREEMKHRERIAVQREILNKQLRQEELAKWRETAGKIAISSLPFFGEGIGRALFRAVLGRGGGCCGCLFVILGALGLGLFSVLRGI
ncbi:MAG: hypothetical protein KA419_10535 [Acidobacteria bacterium]|nr:hypothetical protein [Acidobacteriota bacterium]